MRARPGRISADVPTPDVRIFQEEARTSSKDRERVIEGVPRALQTGPPAAGVIPAPAPPIGLPPAAGAVPAPVPQIDPPPEAREIARLRQATGQVPPRVIAAAHSPALIAVVLQRGAPAAADPQAEAQAAADREAPAAAHLAAVAEAGAAVEAAADGDETPPTSNNLAQISYGPYFCEIES